VTQGAKSEVDALGVITISRGCFERCWCVLVSPLYYKPSKKTPPYHSGPTCEWRREQKTGLTGLSKKLFRANPNPREYRRGAGNRARRRRPPAMPAHAPIKRSTGHANTHTDREQHPRHRHTRTRQEQHPKPPNEHLPQTLNNAPVMRGVKTGSTC